MIISIRRRRMTVTITEKLKKMTIKISMENAAVCRQ